VNKIKNLTIFVFIFFISSSFGNETVILSKEKGIYILGYHLSFLKDEKGTLTLNDVLSPEISSKFKKYEKRNPNFGITSDYYWARFDVDNRATDIPYWFLSFELEFLDEINFYKKEGDKWEVKETGDIFDFKTRERNHRSFVFKMKPKKRSFYYLRIRNSTSTQFPVKIYSPDAFEANELQNNIVMGSYFGMMMVMFFYNIFLLLSTKNRSYFYYISYIFFWTFMSVTVLGLGHQYIFSNYPWFQNEGFGIQLSLVFLSLVMFTQDYLKLKEATPNINKKLNILKMALVLLGLCTLVLDAQKVMFAIYACAGGLIGISIYSGYVRYKMNYRPAMFYLLAFGVFFLFSMLRILLEIGIFDENAFLKHSWTFGSTFQIVLFSLGLADIINSLKKEAVEKNRRLISYQEQLVEMNQGLEEKVRERTIEIQKGLKEISNLLDNMSQAVFTINSEGTIMAPVSKYTRKIFFDEIEGRNIFDVLFINIDSKSEMFSIINFSMACIFDSDETQWIALKDTFPASMTLINEDKKKNKVLKITYEPILDDNEILQNLMFIIEDVTELQKLEKEIEIQKESSLKKVKILQEVGKNKRNELDLFFSSSLKQIQENLTLFMNIRECLTTGKEIIGFDIIFRNFHTLKGNSRIFGFSYLPPIIHEVEDFVVQLIGKNEKGELTIDEIKKITQNIYSLQGELNEYLKISKEIYKFDLIEDKKIKNDFFNSLKEFEFLGAYLSGSRKIISHSEGEDLNPSFKLIEGSKVSSSIEAKLKRSLHSFKGISKSLGEKDLPNSIHQIESSLKMIMSKSGFNFDYFKESFIPELEKIEDRALAVFLESDYDDDKKNRDIGFWIPISYSCFKITQNLSMNSWSREDLFSEIYFLIGKFQEGKLDYLEGNFNFLFDRLKEKTELDKELITYCLEKLWDFLFLVFNLDTNKFTNEAGRRKIKNVLKNEENIKKIKGELGQTILASFLRKIDREGISINEFFNVLSRTFEIKKDDIIQSLLIEKSFTKYINDIYLELRKNLNVMTLFNLERVIKDKEITIIKRIERVVASWDKTWFFFSKKKDVLILLREYTDLEENLEFEVKPQVLEILSDNYNQLKEIIENKYKNENSDLSHSFQKILHLPVKYSFLKFDRLIKDISSNLGKEVRYKLKGDQGSLNRDKLSLLQDAVTHLIRNSLDHGIEKPEKRESLGKERVGVIEVSFSGEDGFLKIILKDDGKGINPDLLVQKGLSLGLLSHEKASKMTFQEKIDLIFFPNLSTKDNLSEISGRGVGMDVVKKNLDKIGGTLDVITKENEGTEFIITINDG
jgi:signal transduction histidine kinase/HPt (histidine-containing phosphotransfer) domain-containing protein